MAIKSKHLCHFISECYVIDSHFDVAKMAQQLSVRLNWSIPV